LEPSEGTKALLPKEEQAMAWTIESTIVRKVASIDEGRSTLEAAILMTEEFIGAVVITNSSGIAGIFTERDLMMRVVGKKKDPEQVKIREVMSKTPPKVVGNHVFTRGVFCHNSLGWQLHLPLL
jgi:CBS domain-containing protein